MFELHSKFNPSGDQPEAIKKLVDGVNDGKKTFFCQIMMLFYSS